GRTLVLINPVAGHDDPAQLRRLLGGAFAARGASFDIVETGFAGHATELARLAVAEGYRAVALVGGDGTLAEVATGLAGTRVPLAIIARGTANQVPRNLGIPLGIEAAVEVAVGGTPIPLDLGRVGDRVFALAAGAGYDAAVMAAASRELKERFGFGAYLIAALREVFNMAPAEFHIVADDRELTVRAVSVMLANVGELFAGYLPIRFPLAPRTTTPLQSWQDGLLDVLILAPEGLRGLAEVLWRAARRRFGGDERLIHFQARRVEIHAEPPMAVQIDGDAAGTTPLHAEAVPHGVYVLVAGPGNAN
ncbi:MAG: diacylglycerol/lipid kinase family protein, partial [Longimicrobiales bacterium]